MVLHNHVFLIYGGMFITGGLMMLFNLVSHVFIYRFDLQWKILDLSFDVIVDSKSVVFLSLLFMIVGSVKIFSFYYMFEDVHYLRFFYTLMSFVISMIFLIICPHMVFVFMGYDGLGMMSFLLVVYYMSSKSWVSGLKTFLVNRLGDGLFLLGLIFVLEQNVSKFMDFEYFSLVVCGLLMMGWFTKSAQYPFSSWLPAAMAAPTPVSALVHSSTLVTAGVYLLMRFNDSMKDVMFKMLLTVSLMTLFVSSFSASVEWDSKKIIAFSTLSQLGLMVYSLSQGLCGLCFFHLINHAMFKALMFIVVGYLMLDKFHLQDLRFLNTLFLNHMFLFVVLFLSVSSLSGFPFMVGFYSKDLMMEQYKSLNMVVYVVFMVSLFLTSYYGFRLLFYLSSNSLISSSLKVYNNNKSFWSVVWLMLLMVLFGKWLKTMYLDMKFVGVLSKLVVLMLIGLGFVSAYVSLKMVNLSISWAFSKMNYIKVIKTYSMSKNMSNVGGYFFNILDGGMFDNVMKFFKLKNISLWLKTQMSYFTKLNLFFWFFVGMKMIIWFSLL